MLAILCPGQGAQSPGFLGDWMHVAAVSARLHELGVASGMDLVAAGTNPEADVVDTAVAQPLLVGAGLATAAALGPLPEDCVVLGHSVGELTAAALAEALHPQTAVQLARRRGHAMSAAAAVTRSGMTAIVGGDPDVVREAVDRAGCWLANVNGAGQLVAAGTTTALTALAEDPPAGARLRPLSVAGAFHTPLMQPARDLLSASMSAWSAADPRRRLVSNADGEVVGSGDGLGERLVAQVTVPVRFDLCLNRLRDLGVSAAIELAPAGVLTGLLRRELPEVATVALRSPADLDAAHELVSRFTGVGEQWTPSWTTVVSPTAGRFRRADGSGVVTIPDHPAEVRIGAVERRDGAVDVTATAGDVIEWLAADGDPVSAGQPLARLQPVGSGR